MRSAIRTLSFGDDNVVAVLPGARDPEKFVVLGGHYDSTTPNHSIAPGADDDAILFFEDTDDYSPYIHTAQDVVGVSYMSDELAAGSIRSAVALIATVAKAPPVVILHTPLAHTPDTQNPYRVAATITASGLLEPSSLLVHYDVGSGMTPLSMTATGMPDEYEAYIPAQPGGTFVDYYVEAGDTEGHRATHPDGAPAEVHRFFVGTITAVFDDDMEMDRGWTVGDIGDNATTGIWERGDPQGTVAQPEDDHTPSPGVNCYITDGRAGSGQGSYDVDGGKTTVLSPVFDLSALANAWVRYHRWYSNDTGSSPETDQWVVDVSANGGATWINLETLGTSDRNWTLVERNVGDLVELTDAVKFRFVASDYAPGSIVEAGVDDFSIVTYEEPTTSVAGTTPVATRHLTMDVRPNPFNPMTTITYGVPEAGNVCLDLYDVAGKHVRRILERRHDEGTYQATYRHQEGSGIFFLRLEAGEVATRKVVVLR